MGQVCWNFPLLGTGNQSGANNAAITMFKGSGVMDGLAREVCQNSLDAKDKTLGDDVPVKVEFELVTVPKAEYPMFVGYGEALKNSIEYWQNSPLNNDDIATFLGHVQASYDQEFIPMLVMRDYNTIGLNGVNAPDNEKSYWDLLVNTEGISDKQDGTSAGSFGIGKNAPFAYSGLNLVLYNTLAKDGGRAFEGVTHLVTTTREYKGTMRKASSTGKYLYLEDEFTGRPILPEDGCPIASIEAFQREQTGTDVAVVGFKLEEYPDWERATAVAIIKNFILAIMKRKIEAVVKSPDVEFIIDSESLDRLLNEDFAEEEQLKYTRQVYETLNEGDRVDVKIAEEGDLSIFVRYDDRYAKSFTRFRETGMLINTTSESLPHYSIVIIVNDVGEQKLSKTLRKAEPPQHTEWKGKNITDDQTTRNRAYRYLREIRRRVQSVLDEYEHAEIEESMDAGVGGYLPDGSGLGLSTEGTDGLRKDVKVEQILTNEGKVLFSRQTQSAEGATGKKVSGHGIKTGVRTRKKKRKKTIPMVQPGGNTPGVTPGASPKIKVTTPIIDDHRIALLGGGKYRLYIESPHDYDNVFISYYAGREDQGRDQLVIKNYKQEGVALKEVGEKRMGPISIKQGSNLVFVEFDENEVMALIPEFSMEVRSE